MALLKQPAIHVDETSVRIDRTKQLIHVHAGGEIAMELLHPERGLEAIAAVDIIPRYGGVIINDFWASCQSYEHCGRGLCGSHPLREPTFVIEANGHRRAANMKRFLPETRKQVVDSPHKCLSEDDYRKPTKRYRVILARGPKEPPPIPPRRMENAHGWQSPMHTTSGNASSATRRRCCCSPSVPMPPVATTAPSVTCA